MIIRRCIATNIWVKSIKEKVNLELVVSTCVSTTEMSIDHSII
jgi:hypothetical protein